MVMTQILAVTHFNWTKSIFFFFKSPERTQLNSIGRRESKPYEIVFNNALSPARVTQMSDILIVQFVLRSPSWADDSCLFRYLGHNPHGGDQGVGFHIDPNRNRLHP